MARYFAIFAVFTFSLILMSEIANANPVASPFFSRLFGYQPRSNSYGTGGYSGYNYNNYNRHRGTPQHGPSPDRGGRSYNELCRSFTTDPYAFRGSIPFPASPICPY